MHCFVATSVALCTAAMASEIQITLNPLLSGNVWFFYYLLTSIPYVIRVDIINIKYSYIQRAWWPLWPGFWSMVFGRVCTFVPKPCTLEQILLLVKIPDETFKTVFRLWTVQVSAGKQAMLSEDFSEFLIRFSQQMHNTILKYNL